MNMDLTLVNRALRDARQPELNGGRNTAEYRMCKDYYLAAFLEAFPEAEWTGGRKRAKLVPTGISFVKDRQYAFAYDMPSDCAKPIELQNNEFFAVEDRLILTDVPRAELLYVSDGRILRLIAAVSAGEPGDIHEDEYLTAGPPGMDGDYTLWPGEVEDILEALPEDPLPVDDYPDYLMPRYEPKFYERVEKMLAAKFAIKQSDDPQLHSLLLQEALYIKQEAVSTSRSARAAKLKRNPWWTDEIGS